MDPFSLAAGIIGLVAAIDSLISLCKRCQEMASGKYGDRLLTHRINLVLSTLREIKSAAGSDQPSAETKEDMRVYLAELQKMMSKFQNRLKNKWHFALSAAKRADRDLSNIERFLTGLVQLLSVSRAGAAAETPDTDNAESIPFNATLARLFHNLKKVNIKAMKGAGVYVKDLRVDMGYQRFVVEGEEVSIVEAIPVGPTHAEKDRRRTRIITVVHFLSELSSPYIPPNVKVVESRDYFYCVSKIKPGRSLEGSLESIGHEKESILLSIARALKEIHDLLILHKDINGDNVIISHDKTSVQLVGFISSRVSLHDTDGYSCGDDIAERRRSIYTAPEKAHHGVPYTVHCDIYSFGVLMIEVCLGKAIVQIPTINTRDDVLALVESTLSPSDPLLDIAKDCTNTHALGRPDAREIVTRLHRLVGKSSGS